MIGLHIIADLKQIDFSELELDEKIIKDFITKSLNEVGLSQLGSNYHTFNKKNEITGIIALKESHISFHTWPEKKYISLDIFVCNFGNNNTQKAKELYNNFIKFFNPGDIEVRFIDRKS